MRIVLIGCSVALLLVLLMGTDRRLVPIPAVESSAVRILIQMHSALSTRTAPIIDPNLPVGRFYKFEYRQTSGANGTAKIVAVATLNAAARSCGCVRNFAIDDSGRVHYTGTSRDPEASDPVVPIVPFTLNLEDGEHN